MVIDFHAHLFNRDWLPEKFWSDLTARAVAVRRRSGQPADREEIAGNLSKVFSDPHGDVLTAEMQNAGIDYTIIMPLDLGLELGECPVDIEEKNRLIAEITRHHAGVIGAFFGIDPRRKDGVELFEKAVRQWGMKGLKLDPAAGYYPNDRIVYPFYEKACELGVPVLCHTGAAIPPFRNKYCDPIYLDDVTLDFPDLNVVAAHMGFGWWQQTAFLISKKTNLWSDISGWQTVASRDYGLFCRYLRDFLTIAGSDNVLFATDGPAFRLYGLNNRQWVDLIQNLPEKAPPGITFTTAEIDAILSKNAMRLIGKV
ncbi:amidohydrolase family protein [Desulfatitalea tepidiphila]|uniref:amidohydrolase family protein n=1 Tax=Desulfatitalea tepidiphila TaxID=1185843 RepID=UPI0006B54159|nr:amidohydrolase family protein [Desulfatitalea tepidiphila]